MKRKMLEKSMNLELNPMQFQTYYSHINKYSINFYSRDDYKVSNKSLFWILAELHGSPKSPKLNELLTF
jgi:hypothetical protein